jgi:hypothetical protein
MSSYRRMFPGTSAFGLGIGLGCGVGAGFGVGAGNGFGFGVGSVGPGLGFVGSGFGLGFCVVIQNASARAMPRRQRDHIFNVEKEDKFHSDQFGAPTTTAMHERRAVSGGEQNSRQPKQLAFNFDTDSSRAGADYKTKAGRDRRRGAGRVPSRRGLRSTRRLGQLPRDYGVRGSG